jgi:hypothetical protein
MKNVDVDHMVVIATAGAVLFDAVREATILALQEKRNVVLKFNQYNYEIKYRDVVASIQRK